MKNSFAGIPCKGCSTSRTVFLFTFLVLKVIDRLFIGLLIQFYKQYSKLTECEAYREAFIKTRKSTYIHLQDKSYFR